MSFMTSHSSWSVRSALRDRCFSERGVRDGLSGSTVAVLITALEPGSIPQLIRTAIAVAAAVPMVGVTVGFIGFVVGPGVAPAIVLAGGDAVAVADIIGHVIRAPLARRVRVAPRI